jgi:TRAP-type C4-dicarboxylate transport system permease small subunit
VGLLCRLNAALDRVNCLACVGIFAAILVIMILQIGFRYVLDAPLTWTEELARYLYVWACYLGAAVALRRRSHIAITLVADRLPPGPARATLLGTQALGLLFLLTLVIQGGQLMAKTHDVLAITLPIPWSAIYLAAPVGGALMALQTIETAWQALREFPRGGAA